MSFYSAGKSGVGLYEEVAALTWEKVGGEGDGQLPSPNAVSSQTWRAAEEIIGLNLSFEITFGPGANYELKALLKDAGKLQAKDGHFTVLNGSGPYTRDPTKLSTRIRSRWGWRRFNRLGTVGNRKLKPTP